MELQSIQQSLEEIGKEIEGGVEMEDIVDYKVPFGILGQLMHPILIKPKLNEIFEYRRKKLIELFGEFKG